MAATANADTTNVEVSPSGGGGGEKSVGEHGGAQGGNSEGGQQGGFQRGNRGGGGRGRPRGGGGGPGGRGGQQNRQGGQRNDRQDNRGGGGGGDFQGRKRPFGGDGGDRNERNDRGGGGGGGGGGRFNMDKVAMKLRDMQGPTYDLPPVDNTERKFGGRNRMYVGNIGNDLTEAELTEAFSRFGEVSEVFINSQKNFAFLKLDYRANAEKAKQALDGTQLKGRSLKIRFAPPGSTLKVKNLSPWVSNELLYHAFSVFGEVERAVVMVDERGRTTGEGLVEFARKGQALAAHQRCTDGCLFLTTALRPVITEIHEPLDDVDGCQDRNLPRKNPEFMKERETGPRLAVEGGFEDEYGQRWKQLYELHRQKEEALRKELEMEKEKLEAQMEYARYEHETEMLREQLRAREMDRERQKRDWEMKERQVEELRQQTEEQMRRQQEQAKARMLYQEEEMKRRQQENNLFMQAHELNNMLDQQEQAYEPPSGTSGHGSFSGPPDLRDPKTIMQAFDQGQNKSRFDRRDMGNAGGNQRGGGGAGGSSGGHWVNIDNNRRDDFQTKRRRY